MQFQIWLDINDTLIPFSCVSLNVYNFLHNVAFLDNFSLHNLISYIKAVLW